jgi:hypothetical protein
MPAVSLNQCSGALRALYERRLRALVDLALSSCVSLILQFNLLALTTSAVSTRASCCGARFKLLSVGAGS